MFSRIGADLDSLVAHGTLDADTDAEVRAISEMLGELVERRPDLLDDSVLSPRNYLFSNAVEEEDWGVVGLRSQQVGGDGTSPPCGVRRWCVAEPDARSQSGIGDE